MIRLFHFKNHFLGEESKQIKAEYSAFGYFDGFALESVEEDKAEALLSDPFRHLLGNTGALLEECDYFTVAGFCEDEKGFWEAEELPFIFITFVRMKKRPENIKDIIFGMEKEDDTGNRKKVQCYFTYDSSDVIVCLRTKQYSYGYHFIESYRDIVQSIDGSNCLQKSFSVCVIKQSVLDNIMSNPERIEDEKISCNLRCLVRDMKKASSFCRELRDLKIDVQSYGILGSEDWLISVREIEMVRFLDMYKTDGRFTYKAYRGAFMNVMSEILVREGGCQNGDCGISGDATGLDRC